MIEQPRSQAECLALAARDAIRKLGPAIDDNGITLSAIGLARGIFGPAWTAADGAQRERWVGLAEREYRKALDAYQPSTPSTPQETKP